MRLKKVATLLGAGVVIAGAAAGSAAALPLGTTQVSTAKATSAGQPTPTSTLLCGTFQPGTDRFTSSNIDHPSGSTAAGSQYAYSGGSEDCEGKQNGTSSFTWTIGHSNVNTATELGTEHGTAMLATTGGAAYINGFNGRITNYDFNSTPDTCQSAPNWTIYYASGHTFDPASCSPSAPGNFNTHGGAATGNHFNGKYQTIVYKDSTFGSGCTSSDAAYCFEAIIVGQQN